MTPEEKELLHRTVALSEENNDILRSIQRHMRLGRLVTLLYWVILIAGVFGTYYYFQPYIQKVVGAYQSAQGSVSKFEALFNAKATTK